MSNYNKKWYENNKEKILLNQKEKRQKKIQSMSNEELIIYKLKEAEKNKLNYEKNKKRILEAKKRYREKNKEQIAQKAKERRKTQPKSSDYLKREYGITIKDYEKMFLSQGGKCAICQEEQKNKRLAVDHCHKTNQVRGLLCLVCNSAIGKLKDDVKLLKKAIFYLENYKYVPDTTEPKKT